MIYYVECEGRCGLIEAKNIAQARRMANDDFGKNNFPRVRPAEKKDIGWIAAMGGRVPRSAVQ